MSGFRWLVLTLICLVAQSASAADARLQYMIQLSVRGQSLEGMPLLWSKSEAVMLLRDGRLCELDPRAATDLRKTNPEFVGYSAGEVRSQLAGELGKSFEVTGTGHYLVAHPRGQRDLWSTRFEDLYREFVHYFGVRGLKLHEPRFPLVAIVWPRHEDFLRYAAADGPRLSPNVLGYYSPKTNRITLYDVTSGKGGAQDWATNADTIIHEASHQTAFNTGVHSRFGVTPRWLAEGLGTLFEARGVWNSRHYKAVQDRINQQRLADFREGLATRPPGLLVELLSRDDLFESQPQRAYAESWALTFFLVEQLPRSYTAYLQRTAAREPFANYPDTDRLADFQAEFGDNLRLLEARFLRFMEDVR
ncbi:MAG: DUF1570 domain-containing protein [Pirellulales bacterium]|nr:DUF1570 domain-containing protein [Pirellulales bacterium]